MKKLILFTLFLSVLSSTSIFGQTFHAIIFANTECPGNRPGEVGIGPSVTVDFERMGVEMTAIAKSIGYKLKKYCYYGSPESFNRNSLEQVLNNMVCAPDDIVYFYYSGHGTRAENEKTEFPEMCLFVSGADYKNLSQLYPLYDVYSRIKAKNPRLVICMGDLCNATDKGYYRKEEGISKGASIISKTTTDVYKNLFLNVKGGLVAASSKPSVTSTCLMMEGKHVGGNFTHNFLSVLQYCVVEGKMVNWETLLGAVGELTQEKLVYDEQGEKVPQTPVYKFELTAANAPIVNNDISTVPQPPMPSNDAMTNQKDDIAYSLAKICNRSIDKLERIHNIPMAKDYFAGTQARVQVVGFDNQTIVNTCSLESYLNYLSMAANMDQVIVLDIQQNNAGKVTYMKVHEIHYQ